MRWRLLCDRLAAGLFFLLPLAPFVQIPTPSVSEFGAAAAVRALAALLLPLTLAAGVGAGPLARHPVVRWAAAWLGIALLAGLLSPDLTRALLGEEKRAEGWIHFLAWAAILAAAALHFGGTARWRRYAAWSVAVTLVGASAAALIELLSWLLSASGSFNYRLYGWYMNPLFFGNALALQAGLAFSLVPAAGRRRWLYAVAGAGLLFLALASGSRSVVLGLVAALAAAGLALRAAGGRLPGRRAAVAGAAGIGMLALLLLAAPGTFRRLSQFQAADTSVSGRFVVWVRDLPSILERPLLGWGLEHQLPVFYRFFTADFLAITPEVFDRAHNAVVESLLTVGVLGLLAAVGFLFAAARAVWRQMRRDAAFRAEGAIMLGMLAYAAAADQFGFLTPFTLVVLVPLLGRVVARDLGGMRAGASLMAAWAAAALGAALFVATTGLPAWAAITAARGAARYPYDLPAAAADVAAATRVPTLFDGSIGKRFSQLVRVEILRGTTRDPQALLALGRQAHDVLLRAEAAHPWDFTLPLSRAALLEQLGTLDPALLPQVVPVLEALVAAHPERDEPRQLLALSYLREGRPAEALRQYDEMLRRAPDRAQLHMLHAIVLYRVGEVPEAFAALDRAERLMPYGSTLGVQIGSIRARMEAGEAVDPSADVPGGSAAPPAALDVDRQGVVEP